MRLHARSLILGLLLGSESQGRDGLGVSELLPSCALFGASANGVRVALARGVSAGLLVSPRRGHYALGPGARALADDVGRWRELSGLMVDWSGRWIAVHMRAAPGIPRPATRLRSRACSMLGLAAFERGLLLRPDNLAGGAAGLRRRLGALLPAGVDAGTVFVLDGLSAADESRARTLWDGERLDAGYRETSAGLERWLAASARLPLARAAKESFELGRSAIRRLVFDPLLPAPLVDASARQRFAATVMRFDDAGQAIWRRFLASGRHPADPARPPVSLAMEASR